MPIPRLIHIGLVSDFIFLSLLYSVLAAERNMVILVYTATAITSHCKSDSGMDLTTNAASSTPTIPAAAKAKDACL